MLLGMLCIYYYWSIYVDDMSTDCPMTHRPIVYTDQRHSTASTLPCMFNLTFPLGTASGLVRLTGEGKLMHHTAGDYILVLCVALGYITGKLLAETAPFVSRWQIKPSECPHQCISDNDESC